MEIGDIVELNPRALDEHLERPGLKVGRIMRITERRPSFNGFPNDQVTVEWRNGDNSEWSTYWLTILGGRDYDARVSYWVTYFQNV